MSKCRQNYQPETEANINKQINISKTASYELLAASVYFDRDDVALRGFSQLFKCLSEREQANADKLIQYQNLRGGRVVLTAVGQPAKQEFETPLVAIEFLLTMAKRLNQSILDLHAAASAKKDPHLTDFIEENLLKQQTEVVNMVAKHHTNLVRVGAGLGVYIFDKDLQCGGGAGGRGGAGEQ